MDKTAAARRAIAPSSAPKLDLVDVDRLRALRALFLLVRDLRSLSQRAVAIAADTAEMDEKVAPAVVGRDEAEALLVAEPLDGSRCHVLPFGAADLRTAG